MRWALTLVPAAMLAVGCGDDHGPTYLLVTNQRAETVAVGYAMHQEFDPPVEIAPGEAKQVDVTESMTSTAGGDCHGVQINCGVTDNDVIEYGYTASDGTSRVLERKLDFCRAAFGDDSAGKVLHIWCDTNNPFPVAIHSDDTVW